MNIDPMNLPQIRKLGLEVLSRELGPAGMIRFLQLYETGVGDYSKERHQWLDEIAVDDIAQKAFKMRLQREKKQTGKPLKRFSKRPMHSISRDEAMKKL